MDWRRAIGIWEVAWGLFGVATCLDRGAPVLGRGGWPAVFLAVALALSAFSALAGTALLRGWTAGRRLSLATQGIQFLWLSLGGVFFEFVAGPYLTVLLVPGLGLQWQAGMSSTVMLYMRGVPPLVGVNLVAAAAFIFLVGLPDLEPPRARELDVASALPNDTSEPSAHEV